MENNTEQTPEIMLPHVNPTDSEVTPRERLVYLYIRNHWNSKTNLCNPSLATLKKESGISIPTLRKCISILEKQGYLKIIKNKKGQCYEFNELKKFEPISRKLLENKDIGFTEKSLLTTSVEFMLDKGSTGKIKYTNKELAEIINMPESTVSKCFRTLKSKDYVVILKTDFLDPETGCRKEIKLFDLVKLGQDIVYKINEHEDRIINNENELKTHSEKINEQNHIIEKQNKKIESLEKDVQLLMATLKNKTNNKEDLILD